MWPQGPALAPLSPGQNLSSVGPPGAPSWRPLPAPAQAGTEGRCGSPRGRSRARAVSATLRASRPGGRISPAPPPGAAGFPCPWLFSRIGDPPAGRGPSASQRPTLRAASPSAAPGHRLHPVLPAGRAAAQPQSPDASAAGGGRREVPSSAAGADPRVLAAPHAGFSSHPVSRRRALKRAIGPAVGGSATKCSQIGYSQSESLFRAKYILVLFKLGVFIRW